MEERETRIRQISLLVQTYYDEFEFLHNETLEVLKNKAFARFLDTNLTIDESKLDKALSESFDSVKLLFALIPSSVDLIYSSILL